jgi:glycolate oxidase
MSLAESLRAAVPEMRVLDDAAELESYRFDETAFMHAGQPALVCFPRSTADVVAIVKMAGAAGVPIVPRGAGTGLSGGAVAIDGCVSVVFTQMNQILEIDPANLAP